MAVLRYSRQIKSSFFVPDYVTQIPHAEKWMHALASIGFLKKNYFPKWFSFFFNFRKQISMTDMEIWIPEQILIFQISRHPQIGPPRFSRELCLGYPQGTARGDEWILVHKISFEVILVCVCVVYLAFCFVSFSCNLWGCERAGL